MAARAPRALPGAARPPDGDQRRRAVVPGVGLQPHALPRRRRGRGPVRRAAAPPAGARRAPGCATSARPGCRCRRARRAARASASRRRWTTGSCCWRTTRCAACARTTDAEARHRRAGGRPRRPRLHADPHRDPAGADGHRPRARPVRRPSRSSPARRWPSSTRRAATGCAPSCCATPSARSPRLALALGGGRGCSTIADIRRARCGRCWSRAQTRAGGRRTRDDGAPARRARHAVPDRDARAARGGLGRAVGQLPARRDVGRGQHLHAADARAHAAPGPGRPGQARVQLGPGLRRARPGARGRRLRALRPPPRAPARAVRGRLDRVRRLPRPSRAEPVRAAAGRGLRRAQRPRARRARATRPPPGRAGGSASPTARSSCRPCSSAAGGGRVRGIGDVAAPHAPGAAALVAAARDPPPALPGRAAADERRAAVADAYVALGEISAATERRLAAAGRRLRALPAARRDAGGERALHARAGGGDRAGGRAPLRDLPARSATAGGTGAPGTRSRPTSVATASAPTPTREAFARWLGPGELRYTVTDAEALAPAAGGDAAWETQTRQLWL